MSVDPEQEKCPYLYNFVWRKNYRTDDTNKHLIAMISIDSVVVLPTIFLNAVVIFAVATRSRLQSNSSILVACLAGTDLMSGLVVQPLTIAVDVERIHSEGPFCILEKVCLTAFVGSCFASLYHIVLITIDRYVATKYALRYRDIVTTQRITIGVLLAWSFVVFETFAEVVLAVLDSETKLYSVMLYVKDIILTAIVGVCIVFIVYAYRYIYSVPRRQKKRLKTEQLSHEEAKRLKRNNKTSYTLAIVLGALLLTYLPTIVLAIVAATSDNVPPKIMIILWSWTRTFIFLGSLLNPVIYCWRIKKLRHAFLEILHLTQPENSPPEIEMQVIEQHHPQVPPAPSDVLSAPMTQANQEPFLVPPSHLQAEEIVHIKEIDG